MSFVLVCRDSKTRRFEEPLFPTSLNFRGVYPGNLQKENYTIQMRARIERFNAEKDETIMYGRIPTETSKTYQVQLTSYTNGKGVFLTNPCGYDIYVGMPLYKARKESASIDKTRHLFLKENV